jgi:hypothetical protein
MNDLTEGTKAPFFWPQKKMSGVARLLKMLRRKLSGLLRLG